MSHPLVVYADENYNGMSLGLNYGLHPSVANIGIPNDSTTSVKVAAFTKVVLFENDNFGGTSIVLLGPIDIPNLKYYSGGFNDTVSSIQVFSIPPTLAFQASCCRGINSGSQCGKYVSGSAACATTLSQYCSTHMNEAECQSYCRARPEVCDSYVNTYCNSHPTDPFCACIRSPAQVKGIVNPKCVDSKCLTTGYLTTAMKNTNCPSIVDCSIQTSLQNNGVLLSYTVPVQQNCGGGGAIPVKPPAQQPPVTGTGVTGTDAVSAAASKWFVDRIYVFLLFLMFILVAVIGGIWLFSEDVDVMPISNVTTNMTV